MDNFIDLPSIAARYNTPEKAREFFENMRWPDGAICPHCGCRNARKVGSVRGQRKGLEGKGKSKPSRPGLWFCLECGDQFSVTEGTVMEATKIPLQKWLLAIYILGASKKGVSAHQLHRTLGVTYKSAWFMAHRVRHAMAQEPLKSRLSGVVELDETYVGGKMHNSHHGRKQPIKYPVVSLVQRDGGARSYHVASVNATNLRQAVRESVEQGTTIYADNAGSHVTLAKEKLVHGMVNHEASEYVRGDVSTNTVEGFFSLLKRGIFGVYHHVSPQHLQRYLHEFDFRYSLRKSSDSNRAITAMCLTQGKRLKYRELPAHDESKIKGGRFWHNQFRSAPKVEPNPQLEPPFGPPTGGANA